MISPIKISPLSPKRTGGTPSPTPLIATQKNEWYFQNFQNASANIITIPDTGTVGGLNIANPALANKPTASTIGTKVSYAADGTDDYLYKAETNFMKAFPTWMVSVVFKYDSSNLNYFLSAFNETNTNNEGFLLRYSNTLSRFQILAFNASGAATTSSSNVHALVNESNYIVTFVWDGTNTAFYFETTEIGKSVADNPILRPTQTDNIATMSIIKPAATNSFQKGNIGYIGSDEYDLTRLNANVATLKTTFGI